MSEEEAKKNKKDFEEKAKTRIKTGLILNEFGEKNQIKVTEQEVQAEVQKQLRMMPGQEKMVMDFYQKNPSALASLRGTVYEEKILNLIKEKEEALILVNWKSKKLWKSIPMSEVNVVQQKFEDNVKAALNGGENPFELIYEGELDKQR